MAVCLEDNIYGSMRRTAWLPFLCVALFRCPIAEAASRDPQSMSEDSPETPPSIQIGDVTVQSLDPRRRVPPQPDELRDDSTDEPHAPAVASASQDDDTEGDAGAAGSGQPSGCLTPVGEPCYSVHEESTSYYLRYVAESEEGEEGHTSNRYARERGFEYRPHPADVTVRSWGPSLTIAFERQGLALFHYMTDTALVFPREIRRVVARGADLKMLLFNFLTELLLLYGESYFVANQIIVESMDEEHLTVVAKAKGERFDASRHTVGTEVKAVTMHEMGIWIKKFSEGYACGDHATEDYEKDKCVELFVTLDI